MSDITIKPTIDDTELDEYISKLKQATSLSTQTLGTPDITRGLTSVKRQVGDLKFTLTPVTDEMSVLKYRILQLGLTDLPSINRELRLLFGRLPLAREAMQTYFRLKRAQMGVKEAIETGVVLTPSLILTVMATTLLLVQTIRKYYMMIQREKKEYEKMVRRHRGWTRDEFNTNMKLWEERSKGMVP